MSSVVFITPVDVRYGFSLAGVVQLCTVPAEAEALLLRVTQDRGNGLVIIDERLLTVMDMERFHELERRWDGILLTLPAPERAEEGGEEYLEQLIRRAVGYHVRLI